ncbi:fimbrial protein [Pseudescherichia vulneris]
MKNFSTMYKKIGSVRNCLWSLLAVLFLTCGINNAMALGTCSFPATFGKITINKEMTAAAELPVGATISSFSSSQQYTMANYCTGDYIQNNMINGIFPAIDGFTRESGIAGVGLRVVVNNAMVYRYTTNQPISGDGSTPIYIQMVRVDFIKTGDITPGPMTSGQLMRTRLEDSSGARDTFSIDIGNVIVKQPSCYITGNSAIPVTMGTAKREDFKGINSTLTPVNVQIPLQCSAYTDVNISFDATSTHGNGIIDLAKGSAEGVGIQLKLNDKVVEFDKKTLVAQTTQQGRFNIPLTAAYIQTEEVITTGTANAVANFTVTYE